MQNFKLSCFFSTQKQMTSKKTAPIEAASTSVPKPPQSLKIKCHSKDTGSENERHYYAPLRAALREFGIPESYLKNPTPFSIISQFIKTPFSDETHQSLIAIQEYLKKNPHKDKNKALIINFLLSLQTKKNTDGQKERSGALSKPLSFYPHRPPQPPREDTLTPYGENPFYSPKVTAPTYATGPSHLRSIGQITGGRNACWFVSTMYILAESAFGDLLQTAPLHESDPRIVLREQIKTALLTMKSGSPVNGSELHYRIETALRFEHGQQHDTAEALDQLLDYFGVQPSIRVEDQQHLEVTDAAANETMLAALPPKINESHYCRTEHAQPSHFLRIRSSESARHLSDLTNLTTHYTDGNIFPTSVGNLKETHVTSHLSFHTAPPIIGISSIPSLYSDCLSISSRHQISRLIKHSGRIPDGLITTLEHELSTIDTAKKPIIEGYILLLKELEKASPTNRSAKLTSLSSHHLKMVRVSLTTGQGQPQLLTMNDRLTIRSAASDDHPDGELFTYTVTSVFGRSGRSSEGGHWSKGLQRDGDNLYILTKT